MPELPEVETVRRTLNQLIIGKTIERVQVGLRRIIQRPQDPEAFARQLEGRTFSAVERRGKFLRFVLNDCILVSHLRMEGRYGLYDKNDDVEKHTHVRFTLTDGSELRYRDVRQFGTMHLFKPGEEWENNPLKKLGVEPLSPSFTPELLQKLLQKKTTKIKSFLLNQEYVAGLGNIYVDEALFRAGLHPERIAGELNAEEIQALHEAIVTTLKEAIACGGSSIKSYVNGQGEMGMFQLRLNVYGKKAQPCPACNQPIERIVVGGRGTHFCPHCQPL